MGGFYILIYWPQGQQRYSCHIFCYAFRSCNG